MARFTIHITKEIYVSYEVTADTDYTAVAQKLESKKLRSYEYEESLKLDWDFKAFMPKIIAVEETSSDETA